VGEHRQGTENYGERGHLSTSPGKRLWRRKKGETRKRETGQFIWDRKSRDLLRGIQGRWRSRWEGGATKQFMKTVNSS